MSEDLFGLAHEHVAISRSRRKRPRDLMTTRQRAVVDDRARFKALLCGRRAGKTVCAALDLADGMLECPGSLNLYVALTIAISREILWEPLRKLNDKYGWGLEFNDSLYIVTHANGSRLLVRGADDKRSIEALRGPAFRKIRIDECGAHRPSYLQYLVEDVLEATLMDYADGDVWLMGTCTVQAFGYFYECTTGLKKGFSVHRWTALENPHVDYHRFIYDPEDGVLKRHGWDESHPVFQREYLAVWVLDSDRKVFRFDLLRNVLDALPTLGPESHWERVLAMDFGVNHKTACSVIAFPKPYGRYAVIEHTWAQHGLAPSEAADRIRITWDQFKPVAAVGDSGGLGKAYLEELMRRHPGIPMGAADKQAKRAALEVTSDAFGMAVMSDTCADRRGLFSLAGNRELHGELCTLQWDEERKDIAAGQQDDISMASVYGYRMTPAYAQALQPPPVHPATLPTRGTSWQYHSPYRGKRVLDARLQGYQRLWSR